MSGCENPRGKTTAAATTGPASGPLPTSSSPAMHLKPREYVSSSIAPGGGRPSEFFRQWHLVVAHRLFLLTENGKKLQVNFPSTAHGPAQCR